MSGGTQYKKILRGRAANMGSKTSDSWLINDPLFKIWYLNESIFKVVPNLTQFKNFVLENHVTLIKIWPKFGLICIWMGHFFFKNWYLYGSTSKFPVARPYQNQSWEPPGKNVNIYFPFLTL